MSNYPSRYRAMLKDLKINSRIVAQITGNTHDSVRVVTRPNTKAVPRWAILAIWVYETMKAKIENNNLN